MHDSARTTWGFHGYHGCRMWFCVGVNGVAFFCPKISCEISWNWNQIWKGRKGVWWTWNHWKLLKTDMRDWSSDMQIKWTGNWSSKTKNWTKRNVPHSPNGHTTWKPNVVIFKNVYLAGAGGLCGRATLSNSVMSTRGWYSFNIWFNHINPWWTLDYYNWITSVSINAHVPKQRWFNLQCALS